MSVSGREGMRKKEPANATVRYIGSKIREHRIKAALTQDNLAKITSFSRATICNIEKGKHRITIDNLYFFVKFLDVTQMIYFLKLNIWIYRKRK